MSQSKDKTWILWLVVGAVIIALAWTSYDLSKKYQAKEIEFQALQTEKELLEGDKKNLIEQRDLLIVRDNLDVEEIKRILGDRDDFMELFPTLADEQKDSLFIKLINE